MAGSEECPQRPIGVEGCFTIGDFRCESGTTIEGLRIGYVCYGQLNASRDNLLLVLPGTGNVRHSTIEHVGPGRAYDTDHYCVVCTDAIGAGTSSQPADGRCGDFPRYSIRDMVRAQVLFAREGLQIGPRQIAVIAGASMGAFQALEWVIGFPESVRSAVLLVPGWRASNVFSLATARMFDFITQDSHWQDGRYVEQPKAGLRAAGRHYFPWTVSDRYLESRPHSEVETEADTAGEAFAKWDAWNLMRRYQASLAHDVTMPFSGSLASALSRIEADVLLMPCAQDRLLGVEGARQLADGIGSAHYCEVDSPKGHLAWRAVPGSAQTETITHEVRSFLGLPRSAMYSPGESDSAGSAM